MIPPEPDAVVTYCFIAEDTLLSEQPALEGEEISRPADPVAPEGYAFVGWFLEDGTRLFEDGPVIAHPDGMSPEVNVLARFEEQREEIAEEPVEEPIEEPAERSEAEEVVTPEESTNENEIIEEETTSPVSADAEPASPEGEAIWEPAGEPIEAPVVEQIDETVEEAGFSIEETVEEVVEISEAALTDVLPETIAETPRMADSDITTFLNITPTIYPEGKGTVTCTAEGETATLTITPVEHYKVDKVKVWVDNAVTEPKKEAENTYTFPYSEGSTVAVRVDFAVDGQSYALWVNGVEVSEFNAADVLGDGTVKYDAQTHTLTLNNYTYEGMGIETC